MTSTKKGKPNTRKATAFIDLGEERRERIRRFCAQQEFNKGKRPTLPEAVNALLDEALAAREPQTQTA